MIESNKALCPQSFLHVGLYPQHTVKVAAADVLPGDPGNLWALS